jgi:hypothetical protein
MRGGKWGQIELLFKGEALPVRPKAGSDGRYASLGLF